ncbi:septation ring formation regulator EzrA [Halobacillus yeomjeoni]|uniref:septation ring formation regulator EzrA n=1 Tax=Halobacillus yeomjeoni TaxID=311194 RepID=UPI001CD64C66|nr:septation ring formation regulator EzrA [Halobacillus yeomjeoni]MCA0982468.1 septation ring formation regulator EzrA [Halobacillus yeomjeoni]
MKYVVGAIVLLIALIIVGLIWRKKIYDEVDRLEGWKMDIMNRRVTEELSKVKNLNLSGETQEKFEAWRERWDAILTKELPGLEEDLFDAEEAADKYQWKRVKKVLAETEQKLQLVEADIQSMFEELEDLLDSEKNSRIEIESIEPELKDIARSLIQNRHQYGNAVQIFEERVTSLQKELKHYDELTEEGNYIEANELVQSIRTKLLALQEDVEQFPDRYKKARSEYPDLLKELKNGLDEMEEEGYRISHLKLMPEIHKYEASLKSCVTRLEQGDQTDVEDLLAEIESRIQEIYQMLEKEAIAHNYVEKQYAPLLSQLETLEYVIGETERELEEIQYAYQLGDEDLESYRGLKSWFNQMKNKMYSLDHKREDGTTAFTEIREQLENTQLQLSELQDKHQQFNERVQNLRKDEVDAKKTLSKMEKDLLETHRRLKRSNIPGIPSSIYEDMKETSDRIDIVFQSLEKQPLDMTEVSKNLEEAALLSDHLHANAEAVLEKAYITERMIQHGNRYKSRYPLLAAKLLEAEKEFRSYEYDSAYELTVEALKEVDPGAVERIEQDEKVLV